MKFVWVIVGTVLAGLVLGFLVSRKVPFDPALNSQPVADTQASAPSPEPFLGGPPLVGDNVTLRPNPRIARLHRPAPPREDLLTNWDERVEEILSSDDDDDLKAKDLLGLFPRLPTDGQIEVVEQAGSLLPDSEYGALAQFTTNVTLAEPVLETLLAELVARPDPIRLPLLLSIAENEEHPESEQARDTLEVLLGEAYGTNWDQWNASVDQRLLTNQLQNQTQEMDPTSPED